jgi:ammonium transporter, Amt family
MSGSYFVGPRIGKFDRDPVTNKVIRVNVLPGHNAVLAALGAFILWGGFFAFNGGSCIAIFCPSTADTGRIVVSTTLSAAAGGLFMLGLGEYRFGIYDLKLAMNGLLAGMVAICRYENVAKHVVGSVTNIKQLIIVNRLSLNILMYSYP